MVCAYQFRQVAEDHEMSHPLNRSKPSRESLISRPTCHHAECAKPQPTGGVRAMALQ